MMPILAEHATRQRVLIADDDAIVRAVVRALLVKLGRHVDDATDSDEALAKLHAAPYDLIILDLKMPPDGGMHVCSMLQSDPLYRYVPVVILTGRDDAQTRAQCQQAGARLYVTKPFTPAKLVQNLRPVLRLDDAETVILSSIVGSDRGQRVQDAPRAAREFV